MKHLFFCAVCFFALATLHSLAYVSDTSSLGNRSEKIRKTPKVVYDAGYPLHKDEIAKGYNISGRISTKHSINLFLEGEFLYWQAVQEDMQLATYYRMADFIDRGKIIEMSFDYEPAFRVSLGGHFGGHDDWTILSQYTRFYTDQSTSFTSPQSLNDVLKIAYPWWVRPNPQDDHHIREARSVRGQWKLQMNLVDLKLLRSYYVGTHLIFHPYFGLEGSIIDQEVKMRYLGLQAPNLALGNPKYTSWGAGIGGGCTLDWFIHKYLKIFSRVAVNILFTQYKMSHEEYDGYSPPEKLELFKQTYNVLRPNLECACGLDFGCYLGKKGAHFDIFAGYEFHCFWDQNMIKYYSTKIVNPDLGSSAMIGNLYLHGPTAGIRVDW